MSHVIGRRLSQYHLTSSAREQESSIGLGRRGLCNIRGDGGPILYSCEEHSGSEGLRKEPSPVGRGQGVVEVGKPQDQQRCSRMGGFGSLFAAEAGLSPRRRLHTRNSWRATQMLARWGAYAAKITPVMQLLI